MNKAIIFFALANSLFAWGPRAHVEIIQTAGDIFDDDPFFQMTAFFDTYYAEMFSGACFPDWSYVFGVSDSYSDRAHELAFCDAYFEHLLATYSDFSTTEAKRELAFYLGILSHVYSDRILKGENGEHGLRLEATSQDGITASDCELYLDQFINHDFSVASFSWFWPTSTIRDVYDAYSSAPASYTLNIYLSVLEGEYSTVLATTTETYLYAVEQAPWTYSNYGSYYPGGLYNCAALSAHKIRYAWNLAANESYIFQRSQIGCGFQDVWDTHLLEGYPSNNAGGEDRLMATQDGAGENGVILLKWDVSDTDTAGLYLDSAVVYLYYDGPLSSALGGDKPVYLYPVNRSWEEGTGEDGDQDTYWGSSAAGATWTHAYPATWDSPGGEGIPGDREGIAYGLQYFGPTTDYPTWYSYNVTTIAREWLRNPAENHGIMLREEDNSYTGSALFISSEDNDICQRPLLAIYQSATPTPISEFPKPDITSLNVYPNPFNSSVRIDCQESVRIFDLSGKEIAVIGQGGGVWSPKGASGVFTAVAESGRSEKLVFLK